MIRANVSVQKGEHSSTPTEFGVRILTTEFVRSHMPTHMNSSDHRMPSSGMIPLLKGTKAKLLNYSRLDGAILQETNAHFGEVMAGETENNRGRSWIVRFNRVVKTNWVNHSTGKGLARNWKMRTTASST